LVFNIPTSWYGVKRVFSTGGFDLLLWLDQVAEKGLIVAQAGRSEPQGLKPIHSIGFIGTTKVVP
jgi:hypothetical protein